MPSAKSKKTTVKKPKKVVKKTTSVASMKKEIMATAKKEFKDIKTKLKDAEKKADALIKKNPEKAVLISTAISAAVATGITLAIAHAKKKR